MSSLFSKVSGKSFLFLILAIFMTQVPLIGSYVSVMNTVIHESGHAFIALLGGDVERISLFMNTEGVTYSRQSTWIGSFFTSLAGYFFSSIMAFLSFWLIGKERYNILIVILLGFIILNLVFWVRNIYGVFWLISFGTAFIIMLLKGRPAFVYNVLLLIASVVLVDSVKSSFDIMYISFISPKSAGDAANLALLSGAVPVQIWGIIFFLQSIWFCYSGLKRGIFKL